MAIAVAHHVESVTENQVAFAVVTRQGVVDSHKIRRREWSRVVAINTACQGVMGLRRVHRKEWSSGVRYCGLSGDPDLLAEVRLESVARSDTRRSLDEVFLQLKSKAKSGSRRSLDKAYQ